MPQLPGPSVQLFGRKDSRDTQKAIRFFKERRIAISFVDIAITGALIPYTICFPTSLGSRVYHWTGSQWDDITGDAYDGAGNLVGSIGPDGTPSGTPLTQPAGQVCGQTMTLSPFLGAQG